MNETDALKNELINYFATFKNDYENNQLMFIKPIMNKIIEDTINEIIEEDYLDNSEAIIDSKKVKAILKPIIKQIIKQACVNDYQFLLK